MSPADRASHDWLRPWLILGRVSNLPTVWSNCLAAWLLGGGGSGWALLGVLLAATCIYGGGMFLNDAWDASFDRAHRQERPIPSGAVREEWVWRAGFGMLGVALVILLPQGAATVLLGLLLVLAVVVYDATHKIIGYSPVVMAMCRFLLYLTAGSTSAQGVTGLTVWSGLVLGGYVIGLSCIAKGESTGGAGRGWPLAALGLPILLAAFANPPSAWVDPLVAAPVVLLALWGVRSVSHLFRPGSAGARSAVSGLLAGIVWVDLLAVAPNPLPWGLVFVGLFVLSLALQRTIPAT